jgi:hypothetical protein
MGKRSSSGGRANNSRSPFPDSGRSRKKARNDRLSKHSWSHDKDEDRIANRLRLRAKRLQRLLQKAEKSGSGRSSTAGAATNVERAGATMSIAEMRCELGGVFMAMGQSRKATVQFVAAIDAAADDVASPSSVSSRQQLIQIYMDQAEAGRARALADRFPDDHSAAFEYTRALLNFLAWSVLAEEGYTEKDAVVSLCTAISANPWTALFMVHADEFTKVVNPDFVDNLARPVFEARGTVDEAFKYCVDGLSCWADCEGAIEWLTAKVLADLPIEALVGRGPSVPTPTGSSSSVALFEQCVRAVAKRILADESQDEEIEEGDSDDEDGGDLSAQD